jgi:hypothetical protein
MCKYIQQITRLVFKKDSRDFMGRTVYEVPVVHPVQTIDIPESICFPSPFICFLKQMNQRNEPTEAAFMILTRKQYLHIPDIGPPCIGCHNRALKWDGDAEKQVSFPVRNHPRFEVGCSMFCSGGICKTLKIPDNGIS